MNSMNVIEVTVGDVNKLNRLYNRDESATSLRFSVVTPENAETLFSRARVLGYEIIEQKLTNGTVWKVYVNNGEVVIISNAVLRVLNAGGLFAETLIRKLDISKIDFSHCTSFNGTFSENLYLTSIEFGDIDTSNVRDMFGMFEGCNKLKSIDIHKFNTSKVENMAYMFSECYALKELDLSNFDTHNVTSTQAMFMGCESLRKLDLSMFDMSKVVDMVAMFGVLRLEELNLSNMNIIAYDQVESARDFGAGEEQTLFTCADLDITTYIGKLILNNFKVGNNITLESIFDYLEVLKVVTDNSEIERYFRDRPEPERE